MIMYLCIKYECNPLMFSKDTKRKLFFKVEKGPLTPNIIGGFYPNRTWLYTRLHDINPVH